MLTILKKKMEMEIKYYKVSRRFKFLLYILFIFCGIEDREAALMMIIN